MFSNYAGLAGFGKYARGGGQGIRADIAPPPTSPEGSWRFQREMMEMKHKHEMEMMKMRLEMAQMQRQGVAVPRSMQRAVAQTTTAVQRATTGAAAASATADVAKLKAEIEALKRKETVTKHGGGVKGSRGKSVKEVLTGGGGDESHQRWMRSTAKKGMAWDDWRKLKTRLPADFDEARYLAKHSDIAAAVKRGQFPSGAWHYVMHGSPNCAYGERHGRGGCDNRGKGRSFKGFRGWRRPGYLSGIFSNWDQHD